MMHSAKTRCSLEDTSLTYRLVVGIDSSQGKDCLHLWWITVLVYQRKSLNNATCP